LRFGEALEAAKKANNSKTWKELNMACVEAREFGIAKIAGLAILVHADLIEDVIYCYERFGYIDELL
jgi:clathrin heavy chain